jgi:hypothetical protein
MKLPHIATILVTAAALAAPAPCAAQKPVTSFDQLDTRLKPGDTVWVTDGQGREVKGRINSLAPEAITLKGDGPTTFVAGDVRLISERRRDSLANGALIGLAAGGGLTLAFCLPNTNGADKGYCYLGALFYAGVGAAIGVGIDALIPGRKLVAYRAPGTSGSSESRQARLSIAPFVTPRAKGVAVSFAF